MPARRGGPAFASERRERPKIIIGRRAGGLCCAPPGTQGSICARPRPHTRTLRPYKPIADKNESMTTTPLPIRLVTTGSGGLIAITACFGIFAALSAAGQPLWGMLSFEVVLLVAGVLAVLVGMGRFAPGFGTAAAVLGATVLGAAVLGSIDARSNLGTTWAAGTVGPLLVLRAGLGCLLVVAAGADVLRRDTTQIRRFVLGVLVLSPLAAAAFAAKACLIEFLLESHARNAAAARVGALFLLGVVGIALASAGGHLMITAFLNASEEPTASRT
jgi:hypothetical protein